MPPDPVRTILDCDAVNGRSRATRADAEPLVHELVLAKPPGSVVSDQTTLDGPGENGRLTSDFLYSELGFDGMAALLVLPCSSIVPTYRTLPC